MAENQQSRVARRKQSTSKKTNKGKRTNIFKKILFIILILGFVGLASGAGLFAYYVKDAPKLDKSLLIDPVASQILDMNDEPITILGTENRDYVDYDQIPEKVRDAVLATEDVRFFKHSGIDLRRLGGAVLANVTRGFGSEGASTITQQVIKRSFLSDEKTLKRKAQEAWLAFQLERKYSKEQIFEMYVNKINYANGIHGIETASKYYFDKELSELELQEMALLAGLPQSPYNYDPYAFPEKSDKRKNIVLSLMAQHGKISKAEMEKAQNISITDTLVPEESNNKNAYKYDSFIDQVIREVESLGDYNVFADGLIIHTTLDPDAQEYTEKMLLTNEVIEYPDEDLQAGIVLQDTQTGEIRAIGGNRFKDIKRGTNYATTLSTRSPGSTIKPILDYGPAIEYLNWSTYEQIVDEPYNYTDGPPIRNFDQNYLGQMSIREALYRSRNVPALKAFQAAGLDKAREFASQLGLNFKDDDFYESASIGGVTSISPMQLAGAYATFGNNGMYNKPHTVRKIILRDGETEVKNTIKPQIAMEDSTAYMVTDMLKDVLSEKAGATGKTAIIPGLPAAGKTGTSNYTDEEISKYNLSSGDVPDSWFAGYTTNYSLAVWTGYDQRKNPLRAYPHNDQQIAKELYKNLMQHVSEGIETPDFTMPKSVVKAAVEKGSNPAKKPSTHTPDSNIIYELFVAGTEPKEVSIAFDKLDAPSVKGEYHEEQNEILFSWDHSEKKDKDIKFEVSIKTASGQNQSVSGNNEQQYTLTDVEPGETYSIEVIAISNKQRSTPGTASVTVPKVDEDEEKEEEIEDPEDETTPPTEEDANEGEADKDKETDKDKENEGNGADNNNNGNGNTPPGREEETPEAPENPANGENDGPNEEQDSNTNTNEQQQSDASNNS
ncbi:PBP1A family penicillin-binding protein [Lederbergia lenta]|uniref:Penicillin-binding protein n=1 Tax=Lederbergia lenta TaxID=1467 RepID=A0A2X4WG76_LEDLE|nr:PBP1A family penicillin-binding protein [Lederbergia lenta]MEC2324930.1 PBP1A family penicillin-binding protein [Lederbergia lenta]SQI56610.1 penicillin-binding protein [Lederbergia lenta]